MENQTSCLWIVATPIGNLEDLSYRARSILAQCDCILAEDTRRAEQLLAQLKIHYTSLLSFYDHNEQERIGSVLARLRKGAQIALISDAGTPLIADPGYRLVKACRKEGLRVSPVPGPSAVAAALSVAGLPPLPYSFLGFLPREAHAQKKLLTHYAEIPGSIVFFERADRLPKSLAICYEVLGARDCAILRELTKTYEECLSLRLMKDLELPELLGELTVVIGPPEGEAKTDERLVRMFLLQAMSDSSLTQKECLGIVQERVCGYTKKELYTMAEEVKKSLGQE